MVNLTPIQLPEAFLKRLQTFTPEEKLQSVLQSFKMLKPVTFRVNTLKTDTETLKKELTEQNINFEQISWYSEAFMLHGDKETLMATNQFTEGKLYIQNLSSMIPALALNPKSRDLVCDLTAAPGSKTTQLAMLMRNKGKIIANDISRSRLFRLRSNLETQGVTNTDIHAIPGQSLWKRFPNYFDKTLVDVPCTMEGRFSTHDPDSYKDWTPKKVKLLSNLQKYLLRSAITATKPGGLIVYSTCTMEPEENEEVIDWILTKEPTVSIEEISLQVPGRQAGITHWGKRKYNQQLEKTLRILPSETMEGFYVAALRKH